MILYSDDNAGVLFHKWTIGGAIKEYISGTINALSVVTGSVKGRGVMVGLIAANSIVTGSVKGRGLLNGVINAKSIVNARMIAYAKISGVINTFTRVTGDLNKEIVVEILRIKSAITRVLRINSKL